MKSFAWRAYLAAGGAVLAGYLLLPSGLARDAVYVLTGLSSVTAILLAVRMHRPVRRTAWYLLAAGQLIWSLGDATYAFYDHVLDLAPFPSPADALYLTSYVVLAASFLLLLRGRHEGRDRDGLLDSAIFTVGVGLLSWVFLMQPTLHDADASPLAQAIGLAYPLADLLLFGLLARMLTTPGGRTRAFRLLVAGGALLMVADTSFAVANLTSGYDGGVLDLTWLASYVLWGTAALHPSMGTLSEPVPDTRARFTSRRLVALTTAGLTAPGTLAVQLLCGLRLDVWAVVASSAVLFLLVIARMAGLLRRVQAQAYELEALSRTDVLTGLPNRRSADAELGRALEHAAAGGGRLTVALLDLDRFKLFNDTFGHQAGDRLLTQTAAVWSQPLPRRALLARYGGEEFLLVCPGLSTATCGDLLAALRAVTPAGQSFSGGIATWDGRESADALVHRADVALYAAKGGGRDRVVVAAPTGARGSAQLEQHPGVAERVRSHPGEVEELRNTLVGRLQQLLESPHVDGHVRDGDEAVPREEGRLEGQAEDPADAELGGLGQQLLQDQVPHPAPALVLRDGQRAHLREVRPQHVQGAAADDAAVPDGDEELLHVLVQRHSGLPQQPAVRRPRVDQLPDLRDVGRTGPADLEAQTAP